MSPSGREQQTYTWSKWFCVCFVACFAAALGAQRPQQPVFRSSVEVTSVDVGVVDKDGKAITDLTPADFTVQVDGQPRKVISADWVSLITPAQPDAPPPPPGYSSNESITGGRLIVIVIDQPNIRFGGILSFRKAVESFIDRLQPNDRIAAVGIGAGSSSTPFTNDRQRVKQAIARMPGSRQTHAISPDFNIAISEAMDITRGDGIMLERVMRRECGDPETATTIESQQEMIICHERVDIEVRAIAMEGTNATEETIAALRSLLIGLRAIDLPKTIVLVSEGFVLSDQQAAMVDLGRLALAARSSIYAMRLDDQVFDITQRGIATAPFGDRLARTEGIELLTGAARGTLFTISVAADSAFARIESELAGYYLLGVESGDKDKDGKAHPLQVKVSRPGVNVRSRRQFVSTVESSRARTQRESVMAAMSSPLIVPGLPLQVATFSTQGPDPAKIQILIHAAVGSDYTASKIVSFGYMISDREGRVVDSLAGDMRLPPVMNGVPSALQYNLGSAVPPGDYTLKLAVAEGDRVGTIEHSIHAALVDAAPFTLSELMVGGPAETRQVDRPTIGPTVSFGAVQGYVEAYGAESGSLKATYEVAAEAEGPALLANDSEGRTAGRQRKIFSQALSVRQLPPGKYFLRARLASDAGPVATMTRDFEIAPPAVLMTSATASGASSLPLEVFLPVEEQLFDRSFRRDQAWLPDTVQAFRERVAPEARAAFDEGVSALKAGDYSGAERKLKSATQGDVDSSAILTYLAATFAASGHDLEAAGAWQTALIDGSDFPQIYEWLGDTLMRTHDLGQARMVLEEAAGKWPADQRFTKPLALLYATFGQGREAVRTLSRYLTSHLDDVEALRLGVEWIYQLHQSGTVAQNRAEDVKLARQYATAYEKAKGPQVALVRQWVGFLEKAR